MTQVEIEKKTQELRDYFPAMFNHKDARANEVWIGDEIVELAMFNEGIYKRAGLTTIRHVECMKMRRKLTSGEHSILHWSFFADAQEYVRLELKGQEKK